MPGVFTVPEGMERTYIQTPDPFSLFYRALRTELRAAGVNIVDSMEDATAV